MWIKAYEGALQPDVMMPMNVGGQNLFVVLNNGQLYCAKNRCPHEDIELTLGCIKGNRVKCSLHGFSFDLVTGDSSEDEVDNLQTYPIKQENQAIYIKI